MRNVHKVTGDGRSHKHVHVHAALLLLILASFLCQHVHLFSRTSVRSAQLLSLCLSLFESIFIQCVSITFRLGWFFWPLGKRIWFCFSPGLVANYNVASDQAFICGRRWRGHQVMSSLYLPVLVLLVLQRLMTMYFTMLSFSLHTLCLLNSFVTFSACSFPSFIWYQEISMHSLR